MAYREHELETYRIAMDPGLTPEEKQAQIDALYSGPALPAAPEPVADARVASADSAAEDLAWLEQHGKGFADPSKPPAPPPSVADVGPTMTPAANQSVAPPVASVQGAPPEAGAPAAQPTGPTVEEGVTQDLQALITSGLQPSRARVVAAHDQPVSTTIQRQVEVPEEIKERVERSQQAEQGIALEVGDAAEKSGKDAEESAEGQVLTAEVERGEFQRKQKDTERRLKDIGDEFQGLVKESAIPGNAWWLEKSTGEKVLSILGALAMGLGGKPEMVTSIIKDDMAHRVAERDRQVGAFRQKMDDIKGRMVSPEAAMQMEYSLGNHVAAAEARRLAASAQSAEAKLKMEQVAQHLETEAALFAAKSAQAEAGASSTQIAHVPQRVVGGSSALQQVNTVGKLLGLTPMQVLQVQRGQMPQGMDPKQYEMAKDALGRQIEIPGGRTLWAASEGDAQKQREGFRAAGEMYGAYNRLLSILDKPGRSLSPSDLADINSIVANNTISLKNSGGLGVLNESDYELIKPITGKAVGDTISLDAATRSGLQTAASMLRNKMNIAQNTLYTHPFPSSPGGTMQRGGVTASDVEK